MTEVKISGGTRSGGLRLNTGLWGDLEKLALKDKRKFNQYVELVLADHVKKNKHKIK